MKKRLPTREPLITSYLFYLIPHAILAQHPGYAPWLYSHYIQLVHFAGEDLTFYLHPFHLVHQMKHLYFCPCPLFETLTMDRDMLCRQNGDVVTWARQCLQANYYLQTEVDFFFVPNRPHCGKTHFLHEILIVGCDDEGEQFDIVGLDHKGQYAVSALAYDQLERAFVSGKELFRPEYLSSELAAAFPWLVDKVENPKMFMYRILPEERYCFAVESVAEQLSDYLYARNTSKRYRMLANARKGGLWGMATYDFLKNILLDLDADPAAHNPLPLRLFWEHKKCMVARLQYMENNGYLDVAKGFSAAYAGIEHLANKLRLGALRSMVTRKTFPAKLAWLAELATREAEVLEKLIDGIERPS